MFLDIGSARLRNVARLLRRFTTSRRGNIAITTALIMTPLLGFAGAAIDYASAVRLQGRLEQNARVAATIAATVARNATQPSGVNDSSLDSQAKAEGERVGLDSFKAQATQLPKSVIDLKSTVTVTRTGNTITATVPFVGQYRTLIAKIVGVETIFLAGKGSMIVGMLDAPKASSTSSAGEVVDETWTVPPSAAQLMQSGGSSVANDWLSGTVGRQSPLVPAGDPSLNGAPLTSAVMVGSTNGAISPIVSKKVYLPAGAYELRYWYKSRIIYPEYEPAFICGTVEREMDWASSKLVRSVSSSFGTKPTSDTPQSARAGVYLDPILINPQSADAATPPAAASFPAPPSFASGVSRDDTSLAHNRVDICAYSSRWIQRSIPVTINNSGYFWLSFVAEPPQGSKQIGFYLGRVQICQAACAEPLNNNWPWAAGTSLYSDSFESPAHNNGDAFSLTSSSFASMAKYELTPDWLAGRYGGVGVWNPASFVYAVDKPSRYDGPTSVLTQRLGIWNYRRMLLMPGVYRFSFMAGLRKPMSAMQWCPTINDTSVYALTDTSIVGSCVCPAGSITTVIMSDEKVFGQSNVATNNTAPPIYRNNIDPSGSAMADCHAYNTGVKDTYCVLVPRTQYYGFQLRVEGPYLVDVAGTPYAGSDLQLGTGGAYLDSLEVSLLSPGVKNKFTGTPTDPGDFEDYPSKCFTVLAANTPTATPENIISGTAPVWPGYTKVKLNRVTVTAPSL